MENLTVVIPTYNRATYLGQTLESLRRQSFSSSDFEIMIVDDGSTDSTRQVCQQPFPIKLRYLYQDNQGDADARNNGVKNSCSEFLVFLDDDIILDRNYLKEVFSDLASSSGERIVIGTSRPWISEGQPPFEVPAPDRVNEKRLSFVDVCSNNMALKRKTYLSVGEMTSLNFPGSSMWCDVDFAYRAYQQGVAISQNENALCWHRDYVEQDLESFKSRMWEVGYRANELFRRHPQLVRHLPMFEDKTPIAWKQDPLKLILRKLARHLGSAKTTLRTLEVLLELDGKSQDDWQSQALRRWIGGGHLFRGYRRGLREF